jgi:glyoxylate/hydroxypyruvate reductase A
LSNWPDEGAAGCDASARRYIHYALAWLPPPRSPGALPNLKAVFSLGAGVDPLIADPTLPDVPQGRDAATKLLHLV